MSNIHHTLRVFGILVGLAAVPAIAGDGPTWNLGGALISQLDSAKAITNNSMGYSLTGAADWKTSQDYVVRTGIGLNFLPGSAWAAPGWSHNGVKTSLTGVQVYGDLHIATGKEGLKLVAGLSLQQWRFNTSKPATSTSPIQNTNTDPTSGTINGPKFGMRLGLDWRFNAKWSGELLFQQTELGNWSQSDIARGYAEKGVTYVSNENPGWIQVGVRYHF